MEGTARLRTGTAPGAAGGRWEPPEGYSCHPQALSLDSFYSLTYFWEQKLLFDDLVTLSRGCWVGGRRGETSMEVSFEESQNQGSGATPDWGTPNGADRRSIPNFVGVALPAPCIDDAEWEGIHQDPGSNSCPAQTSNNLTLGIPKVVSKGSWSCSGSLCPFPGEPGSASPLWVRNFCCWHPM